MVGASHSNCKAVRLTYLLHLFPLLHGEGRTLLLQISLAVQVHGLDKAFTTFKIRGQQQRVARNRLPIAHTDKVTRANVHPPRISLAIGAFNNSRLANIFGTVGEHPPIILIGILECADAHNEAQRDGCERKSASVADGRDHLQHDDNEEVCICRLRELLEENRRNEGIPRVMGGPDSVGPLRLRVEKCHLAMCLWHVRSLLSVKWQFVPLIICVPPVNPTLRIGNVRRTLRLRVCRAGRHDRTAAPVSLVKSSIHKALTA